MQYGFIKNSQLSFEERWDIVRRMNRLLQKVVIWLTSFMVSPVRLIIIIWRMETFASRVWFLMSWWYGEHGWFAPGAMFSWCCHSSCWLWHSGWPTCIVLWYSTFLGLILVNCGLSVTLIADTYSTHNATFITYVGGETCCLVVNIIVTVMIGYEAWYYSLPFVFLSSLRVLIVAIASFWRRWSLLTSLRLGGCYSIWLRAELFIVLSRYLLQKDLI
jgi:hypothetical protein